MMNSDLKGLMFILIPAIVVFLLIIGMSNAYKKAPELKEVCKDGVVYYYFYTPSRFAFSPKFNKEGVVTCEVKDVR